MAFTMDGLWNNSKGVLYDTFSDDKLSYEDRKKREQVLKGGQSPMEDKQSLGVLLEAKSNPGIDTSQQSRIHKRDLTDKQATSVALEKGDIPKETNWQELGSMLSEMSALTGGKNKKKIAPPSIQNAPVISGAGRLGNGMTLAQLLKYMP